MTQYGAHITYWAFLGVAPSIAKKYRLTHAGSCMQGHRDLAGLHGATRGPILVSSAILPLCKIAGPAVLTGRTAGLQAGLCSACPQLARPAAPSVACHPVLSQLRHFTSSRASFRQTIAGHSMAVHGQSQVLPQPSGVLEQEVTTVEIPLSITTPAQKDSRFKHHNATHHFQSSTSAVLASSSFTESLAERIKAGAGRRNTTQVKTHVPSAAVKSLADTVDAIIAPDAGATARYHDTTNAEHNAPSNVPGMSDEQPKKRRKSRSSKPALLQTAAQLAQAPVVMHDVLQEDAKVCRVNFM